VIPALPYPKPPAVPKPPSSLSAGFPKFKRAFPGPKPLISPPSFQHTLPYRLGSQQADSGPYGPRDNLIRMLSSAHAKNPHDISGQLLQALQGGGVAQDPLRRNLLHQIVRAMLGG